MLKPKFDLDASLDRAIPIVLERTSLKTEAEALPVALVIARRAAAVVRMAHAKPWSTEWHQASRRVAECDAELAPWGLA